MDSEVVKEHKAHAPESVACAVITISDSRTEETDEGGRLVREMLQAAGHKVVVYRIVREEPEEIREALREQVDDRGVDVVIATGGTGIAPRDRTYEVLSELLEKRLDGFGELFRGHSYEEIGSAAMLSRAVAGVAAGTVLFALPGSPAGARLAMERLILPEIGHVVGQMRR